MNKKATLLIDSLAGGGAERVCVTICNKLAKRGWSVILIVMNLKNNTLLDSLSNDVIVISLKSKSRRNGIIKLHHILKSNNIDVILAFNFEWMILLYMLRSFSSLEYIILGRAINTLSKKKAETKSIWKKYVVYKFVDFYLKKIDTIICQCEGMMQDFIEMYPDIDKNKLKVIYNPINPQIEEYVSKNDIYCVNREDFILLAGRLEPQKGVDVALKIFKKIHKEHPNVVLKIFGEGSRKSELINLSQELNIGGNVQFLGFKKNIIPFYLRAKVTILTSFYEGFPNVLIDSISLGTPVISFNCPNGPKEIIKNGLNGFLIENRLEEDFVERIDHLLKNKIERNRILETANRFSSESILDKYEQLIENCLNVNQ